MARLRISTVAMSGALIAVLAACGGAQNAHRGAHVGSTSPLPGATAVDRPIVTQKVGRPYQVFGRWYTPARQDNYDQVGQASWYGADFHGRPTANGETFDMNQLTAAHPTLPIPSYVEVTNLDNGRVAVLRVNDRGPFSRNRILDVSRRAAEELGFRQRGTANVRVTYLGPREAELGTPRYYTASVGPARSAPATPAPATAFAQAQPAVPSGPAPVAAPSSAIAVEPMARADAGPPAPIMASSMEPAAHPAAVAALGGWFIQAGAYSQSQRAETVRAQLGEWGNSTIETVDVAGQTLHRVLLGPYPAELAARAARYQVAGAGFGDARLVLRN